MKVVLNFSEKEIAVSETCNFLELVEKLKKLLGDDLQNWSIAYQQTTWIHQYWPQVLYEPPLRLTWVDTGESPYKITYGDTTYSDTVICFTDHE